MSHQFKYCPSLTNYVRRKSRVVDIGGVPLGGGYPIRIQSMTIAPTMNTAESIAESIRIIESGGEYVRLTAPSIREAENLKNIRDGLRKQGYKQPLIADIHFTPNAAIAAAKIVEKVRINPGNYADRKKFQVKEYTDETYKAELERIYERFSPLVKVCKEHGTAMRIGTNHGSLSDRILNRYGDTPLGMVESALEFIRICEDHTYYDIVLSMKASNPLVMVEAYRLLVNRMDAENMNYPLHLGVTEAGEGEDARIKSAMGIGALLEDGLGDTIRVSLTEPPEFESPVARRIVNRYHNRSNNNVPKKPEISSPVNPFVYNRRETYAADTIGGSEVPRVIVDFQNINPGYEDFKIIGYDYAVEIDKWNMSETAADFVYLGTNETSINLPPSLSKIFDYGHWSGIKNNKSAFPLYKGEEYLTAEKKSERINFVIVSVSEFELSFVRKLTKAVLVLDGGSTAAMSDYRRVIFQLIHEEIKIPVIIKHDYTNLDEDEFQLYSAIDFGGLLLDGLSDGLWVNPVSEMSHRTVFGILQASRTRISKTEFISCPSCGRTLFDLQETSAMIREKTGHLKGLKIGIMGCIVNGPGEMADADYGYVGTGVGKITLYRGKEPVKRNIPTEDAVEYLIDLIKEDGKWIEAPVTAENSRKVVIKEKI